TQLLRTYIHTCITLQPLCASFFFFNDPATTEIYTLSLHDALPISRRCRAVSPCSPGRAARRGRRSSCCAASCSPACSGRWRSTRSEEHTSELQSRSDLVCRLLLEKKKKKKKKQKKKHIH